MTTKRVLRCRSLDGGVTIALRVFPMKTRDAALCSDEPPLDNTHTLDSIAPYVGAAAWARLRDGLIEGLKLADMSAGYGNLHLVAESVLGVFAELQPEMEVLSTFLPSHLAHLDVRRKTGGSCSVLPLRRLNRCCYSTPAALKSATT